MSELSRSDVVALLGNRLSDATIADIVATGISKDELIAARDRVLRDHAAHNPGPKLQPGHVAQVVDILERLHAHGLLGSGGTKLE
jgi:hypothetical protein